MALSVPSLWLSGLLTAVLTSGVLLCCSPPEEGLAVSTAQSSDRLGVVLDVSVDPLTQWGDVANCGPTAAAMVLSHAGVGADPAQLRDQIGAWSWSHFPLRAFSLPGRSSGMTTPAMMKSVLETFGGRGRFRRLAHPFLPGDAFALTALRSELAQGHPVLLMVESPVLWGTPQAGLHWIVVRGADEGDFLFNDPAYGEEHRVSAERLWRAWRLHPLWRKLAGLDSFTGFVIDTPAPCLDESLRIARACPPSR